MSLPHTGQLQARVLGVSCQFNGDEWTTPNPKLTAILNGKTKSLIKQHYTIEEIARRVFHNAGLESSAKILHFECDVWPGDLPDGVVE
jgi:hypothetical protein